MAERRYWTGQGDSYYSNSPVHLITLSLFLVYPIHVPLPVYCTLRKATLLMDSRPALIRLVIAVLPFGFFYHPFKQHMSLDNLLMFTCNANAPTPMEKLTAASKGGSQFRPSPTFQSHAPTYFSLPPREKTHFPSLCSAARVRPPLPA